MTYEESLAALADPTRRQIYEHVTRSAGSVADISKGFPISRPAVSQHLKVLSDAGLVAAKQQGNRRIYRATPDGLAELRQYLDRLWGDVLGEFAKSFEKEL
ncbi:ArsR/SmtB family transcription factor [Cognatishimia maritima]|uniref:DNA-binding transcriptional regulator, ArsR family n=1 Tax=Cognatishimia maritima TaxID=870908 RepID=A0A1M5UYX8_9RHOB|nr:metalloregulator ArsR/SmtB family transcription factor [Cognatishimia maritima]SHH68058.1 DNA-binding transcriptional regulator, ArsR family [Cognatishimia maritima]